MTLLKKGLSDKFVGQKVKKLGHSAYIFSESPHWLMKLTGYPYQFLKIRVFSGES